MVHVRMPRFSIGYNAALETSLSRLGLASVFDPSQTDFSGMSEEEQLSVSSLTHKYADIFNFTYFLKSVD